ncbi:Protein FD [Linum perenne]
MLSSSSTSGDDNNRHHHHNIIIAAASSSTSSSDPTSSPTFYPPNTTPLIKSKTMEEVWKDINLSSLQDHCPTPGGDHDLISLTPPTRPHHHHHHHNQNPNFIFQDFFSRPFDQDPPPRIPSSSAAVVAAAVRGSRASPLPPHVTVLSLNSSPGGFDFLQNDVVKEHQSHQQQGHDAFRQLGCNDFSFNGQQFEGLDSSAAAGIPLSSFQKKRVQESDDSSAGGGGEGDRRHKRMIKNRESAARSRARKQETSLSSL